MKKGIYLVCILICIFVVAACTPLTSDTEAGAVSSVESAPISEEDGTLVITNSADMLKAYNDYDALIKDAENIFTGKSIDVSTIFENDTLYTISSVVVEKVYKGNFKPGDTILIDEVGGKTTLGEYVKGTNTVAKDFDEKENLDMNQKVLVGFDGFFPIQPNEELLLFANSSNGFYKSIADNTYYVVGSYAGKFLKTEGFFERAQDEKDENYKALKISEKELDELLTSIQ